MLKIGLLIVVLSVIGLSVGGGLIVYSQTRSKGAEVVRRAFEDLQTPIYLPVVARVNGAEIRGEKVQLILALDAEGRQVMPEYYQALGDLGVGQPPDPRRILERIIKQELIYQEARRRAVLCSDDEVRKVAQDQLGLSQRVDPGLAEAWAADLGIPVDELMTHPEVFENYSRLCAGSNLWQAVIPGEARSNPTESKRIWEEFVQSLREQADIQILEPGLQ